MKKVIKDFILFLPLLKNFIEKKISLKKIKETKAETAYLNMVYLVESKSYIFEAEEVNPFGGANISIKGEGDYLKIENDCVNTFLPYFGVLHSNVGNYGNGSISINNAIESYKVFYNDVKKKISIKLKGYKNLEAFNIILEVYVGGAASLSIFGSNRSTICYDGIIHKVK